MAGCARGGHGVGLRCLVCRVASNPAFGLNLTKRCRSSNLRGFCPPHEPASLPATAPPGRNSGFQTTCAKLLASFAAPRSGAALAVTSHSQRGMAFSNPDQTVSAPEATESASEKVTGAAETGTSAPALPASALAKPTSGSDQTVGTPETVTRQPEIRLTQTKPPGENRVLRDDFARNRLGNSDAISGLASGSAFRPGSGEPVSDLPGVFVA